MIFIQKGIFRTFLSHKLLQKILSITTAFTLCKSETQITPIRDILSCMQGKPKFKSVKWLLYSVWTDTPSMAMEIPGKCMNRLNQIPTAFNLFRQLAEILDFDGLESFGHSLYRSDLCEIKIMGFLLNFFC